MKFRNQARLCLAVFDFEVYIMLSLRLTFQGTELQVREKINSSGCEATSNPNPFLSDFY